MTVGRVAASTSDAERRAPEPGRVRDRFALRRGVSRWAYDVATERAERPAGIALPDGRALESRRLEGGLHVRVSRGGAGLPTVVLVHGVIVSSRYLMPLGVELAGEHRVVVPDLPGYGMSAPPEE